MEIRGNTVETSWMKCTPAKPPTFEATSLMESLTQAAKMGLGFLSLMHNPVPTLWGAMVGTVSIAAFNFAASKAESDCHKALKTGNYKVIPSDTKSSGEAVLRDNIRHLKFGQIALKVGTLAGGALLAFHPQSPASSPSSFLLGFCAIEALTLTCMDMAAYFSSRSSASQPA